MKTQRGLSLVELMVAMVIGLVLVLGLGQTFLSLNQTSTLRHKLSVEQNAERMALLFLETAVNNAGYYSSASAIASTTTLVFPAVTPANGAAFVAGQTLTGTSGVGGTDTLSVRFIAATGGGSQGCTDTVTAGDSYIDVFYVDVPSGSLRCVETKSSGTNTYILINGVTAMKVLFGVDTTGSKSATEYLGGTGATSVTASSNWSRVKTVSVQLYFNSPVAGDVGQAATATFTLSQTIPYKIGLF